MESELAGLPPRVERGDPDYERTRSSLSFNARVAERYPAAIVRPRGVEDIRSTLARARNEGLRIGVRSGGHSWINSFLVDEGVVLDMSAFDRISIKPELLEASVGPATTNAQLLATLAPRGLAFPFGHCPSVALGGYLLAGGFGWNSNQWGPAAMSVKSLEVVTGAGEVLQVDADRNPELFWLARGAGVGFPGVITRFDLALQPMPGSIRVREWVFSMADIDALSLWIEAVIAMLGPQVEVEVKFTMLKKETRPAVVITAVAFADDERQANAALGPFDALRCPVQPTWVEIAQAADFASLHAHTDSYYPAGHRYAAEALTFEVSFSEMLRRAASLYVNLPNQRAFFVAGASSSSPAELPAFDAAFSISGRCFVACYAVWQDAADDAMNLRWYRSVADGFEPMRKGRYIAEADLESGACGAATCFSLENWERLAQLRQRYDPAGVFATPPLWDIT